MEARKIFNFLRNPIQYIIHNSKDYQKLAEDKNTQEKIHKEVEFLRRLGYRSKEDFLCNRVCELVNRNEEIDEQLDFFGGLISEYEQGVEESPKYQLLLGENTILKKRNEGLENLCGFLKNTVRRLNKANKENLKLWIRWQDHSYEEKANTCDSKLSYIVIGGHGRIVAATPKFLEKFHFEEEDIIGRNYFNVLKSSDKPEFYQDMKKLFGELGKLEKIVTIFDGKRKERHILFVRYEPENVPFIKLDELKNLETTSAYFYTRVDVHEIGFLKKVGNVFKMFYKETNGEPEDIQEFIEYKHIEALKKKDAEFGEIAAEMIAKGVTGISKLWESSKDLKDFRKRCQEFLLEKQKKSKK